MPGRMAPLRGWVGPGPTRAVWVDNGRIAPRRNPVSREVRTDSTTRFDGRVRDYARYRPGYPPTLLAWLREILGIGPPGLVADIGSGTGISAGMFLDAGFRVVAVEPNAAMRAAAERRLGGRAGFRSVNGRAEATGLADGEVDLVSVAQAFHWFDPGAARREFARLLGRGGLCLVFWNHRRLSGSAFLEGYERLLGEYGTDYHEVARSYPDDLAMKDWYGSGYRAGIRLEHRQRLDWAGLCGRLQSSSYVPAPGQAGHAALLDALRRLFADTATDGTVELVYDTRAFAGTVSESGS